MFTIEFSDYKFRIVSPDDYYNNPVPFLQVSSIDYENAVYICYLTGDEAEIKAADAREPDADGEVQVAALKVHVYKIGLGGLPTLVPVPAGEVVFALKRFDDEPDEDDEDEGLGDEDEQEVTQ